MHEQDLLLQLRLHLPDAAEDDEELTALLDDAGALIRALTWRGSVPEALENAQVRLAVVLYNRRGMEGETEHAEGDVRRSGGGLPDELRREIFAFRLAKA